MKDRAENAAPMELATRLVEQNLLTRWQAEQLLAGRTAFFLGKYKLVGRIGAGGMGSVYRAEQLHPGPTDAII